MPLRRAALSPRAVQTVRLALLRLASQLLLSVHRLRQALSVASEAAAALAVTAQAASEAVVQVVATQAVAAALEEDKVFFVY